MKVSELINLLSAQPMNAKVVLPVYEHGWDDGEVGDVCGIALTKIGDVLIFDENKQHSLK